MATLVNISRNVVDSFYRYKMERVQVRQQGHHTNIINLAKICASIDRPTEYVLKFLGQQLGCGSRSKNDHFLTGIKSDMMIQDSIFDFIDAYVLCKHCGNPETKLTVQKQRLVQTCKACGTISKLSSDKTTTMFVKGMTKKDTSKRKVIRKVTVATEVYVSDDSDDDWSLDTSPEAVLARKKAVFE